MKRSRKIGLFALTVAILSLGFARQEPDLAVPALIKILEYSHQGPQHYAVAALGAESPIAQSTGFQPCVL